MGSVLAVVSKAMFEKQARRGSRLLGVGEVWPTDRYVSRNPGLKPLASGGRLYLVTVRPPDERLWLVAILESPTFDGEQWIAAPNQKGIADVTAALPGLVFTTGKGVAAEPGKLGMSLQTPRALTEGDEELLREGARPPVPARGDLEAFVTSALGDHPTANALLGALRDASAEVKIAALKHSVGKMPELRRSPGIAASYEEGSALYGTAVALYRSDLPLGEDDLVELLERSRHDCGHGCDIDPPLDLATAHAKEHGLSPRLADAVRGFVDALSGLRSVHANHVKRKASLVLQVDPNPPKGPACWSDRFRRGLAALPAAERVAWQRWVLSLKIVDHWTPGKEWTRNARSLAERVGPTTAVERLRAWWPDPAAQAVWPIQTGGSNLLKNQVWLLDVLADLDPAARPACDALAAQLARVGWKPAERAEKVAVVTALYLSRRPPVVAWEPLRRLLRWSDETSDGPSKSRIPEVVGEYAALHRMGDPRA